MRLFPLLFSLLALTVTVQAEKRPNILLILADDMGYECLTANGGETYQTPRLDELAANGIRYEHCHAQPICTPSRVQIMTGIYNNRNYVKFGVLDPEAKTFGHLFQEAGYKTVISGKWQLEGGFEGPTQFGFDEYCLWQLTRRPPRFPNPGFEINGKQVDFKDGEYGPDIASNYLCEFFERNQDEPFLAYYPMILPHFPFQPTPESEAWNPTESREYPKSEWRDEWFQDMVYYTDKMVGKLVDKLEELGLRENTPIIFTGDNGTYAGMKSDFQGGTWIGAKGKPKDAGTRVPLVVNWPGAIEKGLVSETLVDFSDMLPTIAEVAGIEVPDKRGIDGLSFAPELLNTGAASRDYIYCWYERDGRRGKASEHTRTQRFKLYGDGSYFDVIEDFDEKNPIDITALEGPDLETYQLLKQKLDEHMAITDDSDEAQSQKRELLERDSKNQKG